MAKIIDTQKIEELKSKNKSNNKKSWLTVTQDIVSFIVKDTQKNPSYKGKNIEYTLQETIGVNYKSGLPAFSRLLEKTTNNISNLDFVTPVYELNQKINNSENKTKRLVGLVVSVK